MSRQFEPGRAVEIISPQYGSGYRIGGRLVLTAAHLLTAVGSTCRVRAKESFEAVEATVVWKAQDWDIALIALPQKIPACDPGVLGQLPKAQAGEKLPFQMYGYPLWGRTQREEGKSAAGGRQIEGIIYLADRSPDGLLVLEVERLPPEATTARSEWEGASGGAIVCDGLVIGVQSRHQNPKRAASLEATPLSKVDDPQWCNLLRQHGISPKLEIAAIASGKESALYKLNDLTQQLRTSFREKLLSRNREILLHNMRKLDFEQLFVDVYVLNELASQSYATSDDFSKTKVGWNDYFPIITDKRERKSGIEVAKLFKHLLIFGKPGSGKTTFLMNLAINCCRGEFEPDLIPFWLDLGAVAKSEFGLFSEIQKEFEIEIEEVKASEILKEGKVFIFLDGLDEVPSQFQKSVYQEIESFSKRFYKNRIIVTCRNQRAYCIKGFDYIEVADFDLEQKESFIRNWFRVEKKSWLAKLLETFVIKDSAENLLTRISSNVRLSELTNTPILLNLLCFVFSELGTLPQKRSDLYKSGIDLLMKLWDERRNIENRARRTSSYLEFELSEKKMLLADIARKKFQRSDNPIFFPEDELIDLIADNVKVSRIESDDILKAFEINNGLLVERAERIWSFSHLTFQEYLTSQWFVGHQQDWEGLIHNISDLRWREVFKLAAESLKSSDDFLRRMKQEIDQSLQNSTQAQNFLMWIQNKAESVRASYEFNPSAIRAFYFNLILDFDRSLTRQWFSFNNFERDIFSTNLAQNIDSNFPFDIYEPAARFNSPFRQFTIDSELDNGIIQDFVLVQSIHFDYFELSKYQNKYSSEVPLNLACGIKSVLGEELKTLRNQLLMNLEPNFASFELWFQFNGLNWIEKLRQLIIKHRNIGHNWQFLDSENRLLLNYYRANRVLVDCLNEQTNVSKQIREEILSSLFLPL